MTARQPVTFSVTGEPVAFARMRIARRSGAHFVPAQQRNTMAILRMVAAQAMAGAAPFDEPLDVILRAEFGIPTSWSGKKQGRAIRGEIRPARRPDLDNVLKLLADACNTVVWRDDAQIVQLRASKWFSVQPKLIVTVAPIGNAATVTERPGELPLVVAA